MVLTIDRFMALMMIVIGVRLMTTAIQGLRTGQIAFGPTESFGRVTETGRYWYYTLLFGLGGAFIVLWHTYKLAARP